MHVFIGYDPREHVAAKVCASSLRRRGAEAHFLDDRELRRIGLYDRPYRVTGTGQFVDERDGRPFSTLFAFTRFLTVPYARHLGITDEFVLFCDGDFVWLHSPLRLFDLADRTKAAQVVQHAHVPISGTKMDGVSQAPYRRKNWSSLILWNTAHDANRAMEQRVRSMTGGYLHGFDWLNDDEIGSLPEEWNWLVGSSPTTPGPHAAPSALHFTEGTPDMPGYENCAFAERYRDEKALGGLLRA